MNMTTECLTLTDITNIMATKTMTISQAPPPKKSSVKVSVISLIFYLSLNPKYRGTMAKITMKM